MNMKNTLVAASLLSILSFGAFAATSVNADQAQNMQSVGTVSISGVGSSPMDMHQKLEQKATQEGASSYRIIEARSGDQWHATAELYK
ncbi:peroxide/acid stress response protein YhcN [Enterobacteriaceae bacterium H16N7]|nr:peroxide/acid stress response protein YhcN [Dryocola clanedunensis]